MQVLGVQGLWGAASVGQDQNANGEDRGLGFWGSGVEGLGFRGDHAKRIERKSVTGRCPTTVGFWHEPDPSGPY